MRLVAALLALAPFAAAAGTAEDIQQARVLLREVRDEEVVQLLTRALDRGDATRSQLGELYLLLGLARFNLRDDEGARLAFKRALEADSIIAMPRDAPPKARIVFDEARVARAREALEDEQRRQAEEARRRTEEDARRRADEEARRKTEEESRARMMAVAPKPEASVAAAPAPPRPLRIVGIGAVAAGGAALIAGALVYVSASSQYSRAKSVEDVLESERLYRGAVSQLAVSRWLLAGGVALGAAGGALFVWVGRAEAPAAGAAVSGSF